MSRDPAPVFPIVDIVEYLGGTPPRSGRRWAPTQCPLHGDRNASATIDEQSQRFNCHVCLQKSEDAIGLIMVAEGVDFKEAVKRCESITSAVGGGAPKKQTSMSDLL